MPTGSLTAVPAVDSTLARAVARVTPATAPALGLLLALFLLSGASGLVYQVLWQRMLALTFGVSAYATATVLAAFMGGLALGGYAAGRAADRVRSPLLWYGIVEVLIGLTGALTPVAFTALQDVYQALYQSFGGPTVAPAARFAIAFAVLLVPTGLMGASFPLIVKAALGHRDDGGRAIGLLYAINTLGAVAGALAAGFVLVGQMGITASIGLAAVLNVVAGALAILVARRSTSIDRAVEHAAGAAAAPRVACPRRLAALLPALLAVSGFCSLAYEVVWTRLLVLFLETTTYAFTVMLAAFLFGIAGGSALVSPFLRRARNGPLALAALQALVAASSLLCLQLVARIDLILASLGLGADGGSPSVAAMAVLAFVAMFPPALFLGMSFPLAVTLYAAGAPEDAGGRLGRRLGSLYAANVFGAIFGALAAGFVLVPVLGTQVTLGLLAALNWAAAAITLAADDDSPLRRRAELGLGSAAVVAVLVLLAPGAYVAFFRDRFAGEQVLWSEEGIETTVTVTSGEGEHLSMYLNRHHQANDADWMVFFHRMLGHVPMLIHPEPRQVLVVGLGGGATAGATTRYEGAEITVVELSRSVVRGAEWFRDVNYAVVEQPNVRMLVDDGRNHLLVSGRRYDVITADAIWPTHAGSTNLYSAQYYRLARRALNEGGVMLQWVNRSLPEAQHKLLMRTFLAAFPHVSLWFDGSLLVGSDRPIDPARGLDRKFTWPLGKAALQQVNLRSPEDVLRLQQGDRTAIEAYVGAGPIITDDHPHLEYFLGLPADSGPRR
jgi:spermidine synthase